MLQLMFHKIFMDSKCVYCIWIASLMGIVLQRSLPVDGLSVPNLCMLEQRRLLNITNHAKKRQEDQIIDTIDTICGGYTDYITCFTNNLPNSEEIGDRFSKLMYEPQSMFAAYKGLCTKDLEALRQIKACLIVTPELAVCYKKYEKGVKKVIQLQDQGTFTSGDLERLACNVSVGRYQCEIDAYRKCNTRAGEIMQNYIFASLSDKCRRRMGLISRYTKDLMNDEGVENGGKPNKEFINSFEKSASSCPYGLLNEFIKTCINFIKSTFSLSFTLNSNG